MAGKPTCPIYVGDCYTPLQSSWQHAGVGLFLSARTSSKQMFSLDVLNSLLPFCFKIQVLQRRHQKPTASCAFCWCCAPGSVAVVPLQVTNTQGDWPEADGNLTWEIATTCVNVRSWILLENKNKETLLAPFCSPRWNTVYIYSSIFPFQSFGSTNVQSTQKLICDSDFSGSEVSLFCGCNNCSDIIFKTILEANSECLQHGPHFPVSIERCTSVAQVAEDHYISRINAATGIQSVNVCDSVAVRCLDGSVL